MLQVAHMRWLKHQQQPCRSHWCIADVQFWSRRLLHVQECRRHEAGIVLPVMVPMPVYHGKPPQRKSIVLPHGYGAVWCRRWRARVRPRGCHAFHRVWRARGEAMIGGSSTAARAGSESILLLILKSNFSIWVMWQYRVRSFVCCVSSDSYVRT